MAIDDPELLAGNQRSLCVRLDLKGRIIVAKEGINSTLEGTKENIEKYCAELVSDQRFVDVHFKKSAGTGNAFPKLSVKVRKEIVSLGLPAKQDVNPQERTGKYLSAEELQTWFSSGKKFKIVDMRNDYEHKIGHFKDSVLPPIHNFRDLPSALPALEHLKDETVLTVCTGGVRCEKASGLLLQNGFKDVYQLQGGIVTYMEKFENGKSATKNFLGSLYVFDGRVTMAFASEKERPVVGFCDFCNSPAEIYVNCSNDICHKHFIVCDGCKREEMLCKEGGHENAKVKNQKSKL
ncbi:MAG: hypothetical protein RL536_103 [Candidatus Parcubacteria bacterium]